MKILTRARYVVPAIWKKRLSVLTVRNYFWITAGHIPGVENVIADYESRKSYKDAGIKVKITAAQAY